MKLYKITGPKGEPLNGGSGNWSLPVGKKPGKWMTKIDNVKACRAGYHLVEAVGIVEWLPRAPQTGLLWQAEGRGTKDKEGTKTAFAQARLVKLIGVLDEVSMRLAAADIAERVLPIFYKVHPKDNRPSLAIQAARDFANGKIDAAARAAAQAAAQAAAGDAAWRAAQAVARDAAQVAAWTAARDAAQAAAQTAAWDAAQVAAQAVARDAAKVAARAGSWDAEQSAARDAAQDAARAANASMLIKQAAARLRVL